MKIAVIGAGGVGGPFGSALARGGNDVTFIARGAHLKAMRENGLRIDGALGSFHLQPTQATDNPGDVGPVDTVLVTVKLWDVETIGKLIGPLVGPTTAVVPLQNGIDAADTLKAALGPEPVMGGVALINAVIEAPGHIRQMGAFQRMLFGELDGSVSKRGEALLAACEASGLDAALSHDIVKDIWEKFVFLVGVSSLTAITRQTTGIVRADPDLRQALLQVMREVTAVGRATGVALDEDLPDRRLKMIDGQNPESMASMAVDLLRGNKLELPWLAGKVVELGRELRVPTPTTWLIWAALKPYVDGRPAGSPTG